jgi:stearoyl-CoA desaturase (delta-9 desaturase)
VHHQNSDQAGDPHSPHDGGFWAHMVGLCSATESTTTKLIGYAPDTAAIRFMWLNTYHYANDPAGPDPAGRRRVPLLLWGVCAFVVGCTPPGW